MSESRPRVQAYFAAPDERATPVLIALGHVVIAAGALENNLRLELARLLCERGAAGDRRLAEQLAEELSALAKLTAGRLLQRLREFGLPEDLEQRIDDAITRRNRLVHHLMEDPQLVRAAMHSEGVDAVVERLERIALDCAALSVELHTFALPKFEAILGKPKEELVRVVQSLDPATIEDADARAQVEALQAAGDLERRFPSPE